MVIIVPVISGSVIVLSAVGSTTVTAVLNPPAVAPSNSTLPLKSGTASKVNALPDAEEVNLGILEFSSTLNNPLPVSNSLTLNVSKTESVLVSTDLILFPLISNDPKVCVVPIAVKLFGIVISFGRPIVKVSVADTTACI